MVANIANTRARCGNCASKELFSISPTVRVGLVPSGFVGTEMSQQIFKHETFMSTV